ncbi:hypothetical protein NA57DRAFT_79819 [Rhizodiscina lignyota]|uniref:Uncharacterized protein n=1 Tax=Rhizodiscina lignyota TaxID=1504668 RepID=A0A9P4IAE4_9PEZI|nr:hypothetical protein NA57DRAFT_79819 [Rhizodiscina lignyota]
MTFTKRIFGRREFWNRANPLQFPTDCRVEGISIMWNRSSAAEVEIDKSLVREKLEEVREITLGGECYQCGKVYYVNTGFLRSGNDELTEAIRMAKIHAIWRNPGSLNPNDVLFVICWHHGQTDRNEFGKKWWGELFRPWNFKPPVLFSDFDEGGFHDVVTGMEMTSQTENFRLGIESDRECGWKPILPKE